MGYSIRPGTQIRDYWPDDSDTEIYISTEFDAPSLKDIQERIDEKWPGSSSENITIRSQKIHTHCLGYDLYDSMDWTDFIIIEKKGGA